MSTAIHLDWTKASEPGGFFVGRCQTHAWFGLTDPVVKEDLNRVAVKSQAHV